MAVNIKGATKPAPAAKPSKSETKTGGSMSFLKQGAAAKQAQVEASAKAEAAKAEAGKLWRFRIPEGDEDDRTITFLDGTLDEDGTLDAPMWHEHTLQLGGNWKNVPCTSHEEPCPICANGDNAALVAGFTVIDHTPFVIKNGPNAGKKITQSRKLFVAKRTTYALLQKLAAKHGGLAGTTWEVSRTGDKSPAVGNIFQFSEKNTMVELKKQFKDDAEPADFAEEITYYNREELIQQGVKASGAKVGSPKKVSSQPEEDLDGELGS